MPRISLNLCKLQINVQYIFSFLQSLSTRPAASVYQCSWFHKRKNPVRILDCTSIDKETGGWSTFRYSHRNRAHIHQHLQLLPSREMFLPFQAKNAWFKFFLRKSMQLNRCRLQDFLERHPRDTWSKSSRCQRPHNEHCGRHLHRFQSHATDKWHGPLIKVRFEKWQKKFGKIWKKNSNLTRLHFGELLFNVGADFNWVLSSCKNLAMSETGSVVATPTVLE